MSRTLLQLTFAALALTALTAGSRLHAEDQDRQHQEHGQSVRQELQALKAQVQALQATVATLQGQLGSLQTNNSALQDKVASLESQLAAVQSSNVLALEPFVSVDPNPQIGVAGPNITFSGANLHLVSGSGATDDSGTPRGLGNLIIGYDEDPAQLGPAHLNPDDRGGSHNLVLGRYHRFTQAAFGGLVAGELNAISNKGASVSGGSGNTASGKLASILGGQGNTARGNNAVILGGTGIIDNKDNSIAPGAPLNFP